MGGMTLTGGINLTGGMILTSDAPVEPVLKLSLDAADYTSGAWIDSVNSWPFALNGGVTYSTDGGGSLVFNPASSQYAYSAASLPDLSTWTVIAWHYYAGTNTGLAPCIVTELFPSVNNTINYSLGSDLGGAATDLQVGFFNSAWETTASGYSLTAGNWYQLVGTYDGNTLKLYVNNTLVESQSYTGTPTSGGSGIRLMRRWDDSDYWGGKLGIVQIYEGALDTFAINDDWNNNKTRFGLGGTPGVNNVFGYAEMNPPVVAGTQLQDNTATVNGSTGFTINDDTLTGVAVMSLSASNIAWFAANYTSIPSTHTVTWGPGSTVASSTVQVVQLANPSTTPATPFVFFIQGQSGAATYNYPFTFGT